VIQRRRAETAAGPSDAGGAESVRTPAPTREVDPERQLAALERRVDDLEALVEGLQDAIHRESVRQEREIKHLEHKTEPAEMARALGRHARERGL
jgi:vacuolar-type H+-ATPase subunit I/STV1